MADLLELLKLDMVSLLICLVVTLGAGFVRGYSGFGFSALMVAGLSVILPPAQVVPSILMLEVVASIHMLPRVWRAIDWRLLAFLLAGALIGLPAGIHLLSTLSEQVMKVSIYSLLLLLSFFMMSGMRLKGGDRDGPRFLAGIVSGVINGASALGGLPVVLFLAAADMAAATIRATVVAYFFATDIVALGFADMSGLTPPEVWYRTAALALPMMLGIWLGSRRFERSPPESFKRIVLLLLMGLSVLGLARSFL